MKEEKTLIQRLQVVSIVSGITVFLGFTGTLAATILSVAILSLPIDLPSFYAFVIIFWFVAGPLLIFAGYNLWKMKKWAAQLAAIIVLFDLITTPFIRLLSPLLSIDTGSIIAWVMDIIILILITLSWKHLHQ